MKRSMTVSWIVMGFALAASGSDESKPDLRVVMSEVVAGSMASEQYCTLVFANHTFHSEKVSRKLGKDLNRKVYEGEILEADWNSLEGILENDQLRKLNVAPYVPPLVIQDAKTLTISIAREKKFQNMEFVDAKSRKPYETELKPLLQWWATLRSKHATEKAAPPDPRCALDNTRPVFSQ